MASMASARFGVRRCRRSSICRLLALCITGTAFWLVFLSADGTSASSVARRAEVDNLVSKREYVLQHHGSQAPIEDQTHEIKQPDADESRMSKSIDFGQLRDRDILATIDSLRRTLSDDMRTKALLDPLVATGEALLRDLSYRVRVFRYTFAEWESLHLDGKHEVQRKEDVIQRINSLRLPSPERTALAHAYDRSRFFINSLGNRLFPWTSRFFGDHMALHSSFANGGRGIVLTAGDEQAAYLLTSIPSFRRLGCDLPIEVMYLGDGDLGEDFRERLEALDNVITRDLTQMIDDEGWTLKGWAAKPFAMLMSSFREVIFVDADALFFSNPALLFDDQQYQDTGALFFRDRNVFPESKKQWLKEILPSPISQHVKHNRLWTGESGHMQDSGVLVLDKWKHFVPLLLATRLNGPDRDGDEVIGKRGVYDMVYGDKETFWLSWELAGDLDYAFHDGEVGNMGVLETEPDPSEVPTGGPPIVETEHKVSDKETVCAAQLLHLDRERRPLWFNGWIERHKFSEGEFEAARFDVFLSEPRRKPGRTKVFTSAWDVKLDNIVCLHADESFSFTRREEAVLEMIQELAKDSELS